MMIVKTPLKRGTKPRPNRRASTGRSKKRNRIFGKSGNGRGTGTGNGSVYGTRTKSRSNGAKKRSGSGSGFTAWKIIVGALLIGAIGTLYLSHVFATQQLLREVEQLEQEYSKARRHHADYRLTYDRMIGPKEIYQQAKELGFVNGGPADKVIEVEGD
ncbi:MAG: hypothetical protein R3224_02380 [Balneolaceae bacterium]|nr:hypothetical protein [Balneolaceae bacterium]